MGIEQRSGADDGMLAKIRLSNWYQSHRILWSDVSVKTGDVIAAMRLVNSLNARALSFNDPLGE